MDLLKRATRLIGASAPHALRLLILVVAGILPNLALAAGAEANVKLRLSQSDRYYLYASLVFGIIALAYGFYLRASVLRTSPGNEKMQAVGQAIKDGAKAYLSQQIRTMVIFVAILFVGLIFLFKDFGYGTSTLIAIAFVLGVAASYIAGYTGMMTAVSGNMRTANAALTSYKSALEIAFRSGAVAGMVTVGMGLLGATLILLFAGENAMRLLVGFGFGGSLAALFMRVGGGIFTKAADVGADLVGKVEAGIPEDDPRNPATIADNVGDNVGDCAGMAADIFESYEVTLVAAIVLGAATSAIFDQATWTRLVLFALMARGIGIIASMIGIATVKGSNDLNADPLRPIRGGFYRSAAVAALATAALAWWMMGGPGSRNRPIATSQLTPVSQFQQDETKRMVGLRQDLAEKASSQIDEAKALVQKIATEKKKEVTAVTMDDLRKDGELIPEAQAIPAAAIQRAVSTGDAATRPIQPYEITASDLLNSEELKKAGFTKDDEMAVQQALALADQPTPAVRSLAGFQEVTNPEDPNIPALAFATTAAPAMPGETAPTEQYQTVGSKYSGAGDSRFVVARVHIKAQLPPAPAQQGMPARPAQTIDRSEWVGPIRERTLKQQIEQQQSFAKQQKIDATIEITDSKPVKLYVGPDNRLALGVEGPVDRPGQLRPTEPLNYYAMPVSTLKELTGTPTAGMAPPIPPQQQMELAVVNHKVVPWHLFFWAIAFGLVMAFFIELLTDYYVSTHKKPVQEVAGVSSAGPAPMIIQGFAYALESSVFMVFSIVIALLFPLFLFNPGEYGGYILSFYGIALVGLGLLTTTGYVLAMDTFGPISDNAQGVFEMSGAAEDNEEGAKAVQRLDAAGNTTKALTKGFAIATAVVAAVALFHSYLEDAKLGTIGLRLDVPEIFLGMLIGGAAPYLFSAFAINAVGRSSFELINEVRRQFRSDPGIMEGTSRPDYGRCVAIVTAAAQRELLGPGILAIALPAAVAFGFSIGKPTTEIGGELYNLTGAQALGGFLAGAILSGQLLAVLLANSGGMWDNAKKLIEDGLYGGKGSEAHKAGVVCDTVGDPFKDTAGPALNPLIKVMNLVALLLAPVVIQPLGNLTLSIITIVSIAALALSVVQSKKGTMSQALTAATNEGAASDEHFSSAEPALEGHLETAPGEKAKKRLTVEELNKTDEG